MTDIPTDYAYAAGLRDGRAEAAAEIERLRAALEEIVEKDECCCGYCAVTFYNSGETARRALQQSTSTGE